MRKHRLENIEADLRKKLKDDKFRRTYELERAKVALAQKIAELRQEKHLKQVELANKLGVSQQFISQIETGQESNLTLNTLLRLAATLGRGLRISFPKVSRRSSSLRVA